MRVRFGLHHGRSSMVEVDTKRRRSAEVDAVATAKARRSQELKLVAAAKAQLPATATEHDVALLVRAMRGVVATQLAIRSHIVRRQRAQQQSLRVHPYVEADVAPSVPSNEEALVPSNTK